MSDIFGKVLGTMLAFILLFFAPFTMVTLSNEMVARRTIMNEMQSFIDEVIDTRAVTDKQLEDLYLGISGLGPICDVEVNRYVRVVDRTLSIRERFTPHTFIQKITKSIIREIRCSSECTLLVIRVQLRCYVRLLERG